MAKPSPEQIRKFLVDNAGNPAAVAAAMQQYGLNVQDIMNAGGWSAQDALAYMQSAPGVRFPGAEQLTSGGGSSLRDQILQQWGGYGDWGAADQDQAADLARLLEANGISDLSKLQFSQREYDQPVQSWETEAGTQQTGGGRYNVYDVTYDGRPVNFLGDVNRDGSISAKTGIDQAGQGMGSLRGDGNLLGWSSRGGGNTSFFLRTDPATGRTVVVPTWGSSSAETYGDIRGVANIAALAAGAYFAPAGGLAGSVGTGALQGYGAATAGSMLGDGDVDDVVGAGVKGAAVGALTGAGRHYLDQYMATADGTRVPRDPSTVQLDPSELHSLPNEPIDFNLPPTTTDPSLVSIDPSELHNLPAFDVGEPGTNVSVDPSMSRFNTTLPTNTFRPSQDYGDRISGSQTSAHDRTLDLTGSRELATAASDLAGRAPGVADTISNVVDRVGTGVSNWWDRVLSGDPMAIQQGLAGVGLVHSLTGGDSTRSGSSGSGSGALSQLGNPFGEYNGWGAGQQEKFNRFLNMNTNPAPWTPNPRGYAHGGQVQGALSEMLGAGPVVGPGGGQDDAIPAAVSDGEYIFDADTVAAIGDGSTQEGARRLDEFRRNIRAHKRSAPPTKIPPRTKALDSYLED